jgi:hypothetical protein
MSRYEDFWNWTGNVLVNGLYNREFYNGEIYTESLIVDRQSLLVGGARLRQVRIQSRMYHSFVIILDNKSKLYHLK